MIDLGDRRLEVLLTPGHSPDALMLLDRDAGLLLTAHIVAVSDPDLLNELAAAVRTIRDGSATSEASENGVTTFAFRSFAITVPDSVAEPR